MAAQQDVRLVGRTLDIIEALSAHPDGMSIKEITDCTSLNKTTVFRILSTLMHRGYVVKASSDSQYRLSLRLYVLGKHAVPDYDLLSLAEPDLEWLSFQTHETVHLAVQDGTQIQYLSKVIGSDSVQNFSTLTGGHNYMYCTGLGKALLAQLPPEEVKSIWEQSEKIQYTDNTISSLAGLNTEISEIKKRGYAIDNEEHETGISCIADVIFNAEGQPAAAISITTISPRMTTAFFKRNVPLLHEAAAHISQMLGYASGEEPDS